MQTLLQDEAPKDISEDVSMEVRLDQSARFRVEVVGFKVGSEASKILSLVFCIHGYVSIFWGGS